MFKDTSDLIYLVMVTHVEEGQICRLKAEYINKGHVFFNHRTETEGGIINEL